VTAAPTAFAFPTILLTFDYVEHGGGKELFIGRWSISKLDPQRNLQSLEEQRKEQRMKKLNLYEANDFSEKAFKRLIVHDSAYFKILNFNFKAGQELPIHSHDIEGQLSLVIIEGEGEFLGKDGASLPAKPGDVVVSDISEPHGLRATTDLRLLVTIAPPI
jgi:quercetin dioxygenase-like cupin family protein